MKKSTKKMNKNSYGDPGIAERMAGKKDAKAAFLKLGNLKVASNPSSGKMKKGGSVKKK